MCKIPWKALNVPEEGLGSWCDIDARSMRCKSRRSVGRPTL